jgi:hypothetical protein
MTMSINERKIRRQKLEIRGELFALCSEGGEADMNRAAGIIRKMSPEERRNVRAGIQQLDHLLDDISLNEMRDRRISNHRRNGLA